MKHAWALVVAAAATLAPSPTHGGIFGGPTIDGDSYKYDGKGKTYDPTDAFAADDTYNSISLTNWDMSDVSNLSLPATVQTLTLTTCKLAALPVDIERLTSLTTLNAASNAITTIGNAFSTNTKLTTLNLTKNSIASFTAVIPSLQILDLSANALTAVPPAIFNMTQLTSLYLKGNTVKINVVTVRQYDFYAGLSDFQADYLDVSSCANGSDLVTLKGSRVCRIANDAAPVIVIVPATTPPGATIAPVPTVTVTAAPVSASPASVNEPTSKDNKTTFIAYGVVFVLLAIGCVGGLYTTIVRRQTERLRGVLHEETPLFFDSEKREKYSQELAAGDKLFPSNDPVLVTWRLDYDSIKLVKRIAKGAFGEVWVGRYRGTKVAVKKLLEEHSSYEASEDFIREIKLMAWLKHPKIVEFIGVAWTRLVDMMAVNEFMDSGDLRSYLDTTKDVEWKSTKLQYAIDTIDAIVYLHSSNPVIIHRDLKSRNILVDSKKGAKLGDFGISAAKRERDMTVGVGTTRWLAPELARGETTYTEAVDIYAFGVILSELDTQELPFFDAKGPNGDKLSDFAILQGVAAGKLSVSFTPTCPENLRFLAERCVSYDPSERPTAAEVAYELRRKDLLLGGTTGGFV